jgi:4'-phosphopantetheinyl transferase
VSGKPPGFSLTHSGELVGVAVHEHSSVGLDVEQHRPFAYLAQVAAAIRAPDEDPSEDFFRMWTRKEALVKATGAGLSALLT